MRVQIGKYIIKNCDDATSGISLLLSSGQLARIQRLVRWAPA